MDSARLKFYRIAFAFTLTFSFIFSVISPAMAQAPQKVLYVEGLFESLDDNHYPLEKKLKFAEEIAGAGYQAVIHAFLHIYPDGSLVMNDTQIVSAQGVINPDLKSMQQAYARLKSRGVKILLALGGGWPQGAIASQTDYDYSRFYAYSILYPNKEKNPVLDHIKVAREFFKFDGFDLDFEPLNSDGNNPGNKNYPATHYNDTYINFLADFTRWATKEQGMIVTYSAAWEYYQFWGVLLASTKDDKKGQLVSWLNLQGYSGSKYDLWADELSPKKFNTGIADIEGFISMGYSCHDPNDRSPKNIQDDLIKLKMKNMGLSSAFIWQGSDIAEGKCQGSVKDYADAITKGVSGK